VLAAKLSRPRPGQQVLERRDCFRGCPGPPALERTAPLTRHTGYGKTTLLAA
jgi:hypothetical protein